MERSQAMSKSIKSPCILNKFLGFPIAFLGIFLNASISLVNLAATQVYQCTTHDGGVIFTDSPVQLHACHKLSFDMIEEERRGKELTTPPSVQPEVSARISLDIAMVDEEFFESPSHDFEDKEFSESRPIDSPYEEYPEDE
jgi:hypothetical protein